MSPAIGGVSWRSRDACFGRPPEIQIGVTGVATGCDSRMIGRREKVADYKACAQTQHKPCNFVPAHRTLPFTDEGWKMHAPSELLVMILDEATRLIFILRFLLSLFYILLPDARISPTGLSSYRD